MIENPMVLPKMTFKPQYQEPSSFIGPLCDGCNKKAVYYVDGDPLCKSCFYDAIDTDVEVRVRAI